MKKEQLNRNRLYIHKPTGQIVAVSNKAFKGTVRCCVFLEEDFYDKPSTLREPTKQEIYDFLAQDTHIFEQFHSQENWNPTPETH